jgi:Helix-turn-helix domain
MSLETQQQLLLERLREAGGQPVTFSELHAAGITFPAAVISELELNGYVIERVHHHGRPVGVRLLDPEPPDTSTPRRRRRG